MSYLHIKRIVEERISQITQPKVIDDDVRRIMIQYNIPEEAVQNCLLKVNAQLKKHYRHKFSKQVVHQLVQQIQKNEEENILRVNEQLERVTQLVQPIIVPEAYGGLTVQQRVSKLQELIEDLPEPEYIFMADKEGEDEQTGNNDIIEEDEEGHGKDDGLIVDNEDRVDIILKKKLTEEYTKAVQEELKGEIENRKLSNEELRERYAKLREELLRLNEKLIYEQQKAEYLESLEKKVQLLKPQTNGTTEGDGMEKPEYGDLEAQITRFRILVEKLEYATG